MKHHKTNGVRNHVGEYNPNTLLNFIEYEVKFSDRKTDTFTANMIAQNLHA